MSTVIKASQSTKLLHRPAAVDLADHLREARQVVDEARRRSADIVAHAEAEARHIRAAARNEAHEAGFNQGKDQGYREGFETGSATGRQEAFEQAQAKFQQEHSHLVVGLQRSILELASIKEEIRASAEEHVLDFATRLASKLTHAMGASSPKAVAANLTRSLELVHERTHVTVCLHPEDMAAFNQWAPEEFAALTCGRDVRLLADESIAQGGCVVRTPHTEVDATLETQLQEIVSLLVPAASEIHRAGEPRS
jgi:flagellar assembly protein FliH